MYEELDCFERALQHFGTRIEIVTAMEMANKITTEDAYQMIKDELKELKNVVNNSTKIWKCADSLLKFMKTRTVHLVWNGTERTRIGTG